MSDWLNDRAIAEQFGSVAGTPRDISIALDAINLMGGRIDWSGLPWVVELLGVSDVELFIRRIVAILNNRG